MTGAPSNVSPAVLVAGAAAALAVGVAALAMVGRIGRSAGHRPPDAGGSPGPSAAGRGRRRGDGTQALIDVLDGLAQQVRAGEAPVLALPEAAGGPRGANRSGIARRTARRQGAADLADTAVAQHGLALAREVGGQVAAVLDAAAATLRSRQAMRAEVAAHSAQARLSVRVLTALPVAVVALVATSASGRRSLTSPAGAVCLAVGGLLGAVGWWWMQRLIRSAGR